MPSKSDRPPAGGCRVASPTRLPGQRSRPTVDLRRSEGFLQSVFAMSVASNRPRSIVVSGPERFVGGAIAPERGSYAVAAGAPGEPGLPMAFAWDGVDYEVLEVLEKWKDTGSCRHGSGERYVRKHWYRVRVTGGLEMKLYFERTARSGSKVRWHLYSVRG